MDIFSSMYKCNILYKDVGGRGGGGGGGGGACTLTGTGLGAGTIFNPSQL